MILTDHEHVHQLTNTKLTALYTNLSRSRTPSSRPFTLTLLGHQPLISSRTPSSRLRIHIAWCVVCGVWCVVCGVWCLPTKKTWGSRLDIYIYI